MSRMTVSRRLSQEFVQKSCKPARKPRLTPAIKAKRLAFAKKHQNWMTKEWGKFMFSDESTLQQFLVRKRHVRRPRGTRFKQKYTISMTKHPTSQMIWGASSENGVAGLFFLPHGTTMNGPRYVELLEEKLKIHMAGHNCTVFMPDGAPCHRSKVATIFLAKNKVKVLDWPGNSPDLNPIENLLTNLKDKVGERQLSSAKDLVEVIKEVWVKEISQEYCRNLMHSMPRCLQDVIKNGEGSTKY